MTPVLAVCLLAAAPQMTASATEDLVARFQTVETQFLGAVQRKDAAALDPQLAKDFGYLLAVADRAPIVLSRGEFLKVDSFHVESFEVRNLSARAFGSTVIVNFALLRKASIGSRDHSGEFAITDVWVKEGKDYKLAARYASRPDVLAP
jgi:hypothetical protein